MTTKQSLKQALVLALARTAEGLKAAHADAVAGATHAEAKPENDKDTRALEQSYLARGQAERLETALAGLVAVQGMAVEPWPAEAPIGIGAWVELHDEDGAQRSYYLAPDGGGVVLPGQVVVVTPASPVGQALHGRRVGDSVELKRGGRVSELTVQHVR
jgi:transcription elongation GreA/GreB family factor